MQELYLMIVGEIYAIGDFENPSNKIHIEKVVRILATSSKDYIDVVGEHYYKLFGSDYTNVTPNEISRLVFEHESDKKRFLSKLTSSISSQMDGSFVDEVESLGKKIKPPSLTQLEELSTVICNNEVDFVVGFVRKDTEDWAIGKRVKLEKNGLQPLESIKLDKTLVSNTVFSNGVTLAPMVGKDGKWHWVVDCFQQPTADTLTGQRVEVKASADTLYDLLKKREFLTY